MNLLDNTPHAIKCPSCGREFKQTLGRLKNNQMVRCTCGANINTRADKEGGLAKTLQAIDKQSESLRTALRKLGK